jgi:hypothetical protein
MSLNKKIAALLLSLASMLCIGTSHASITYEVTALGAPQQFQYTYHVNDALADGGGANIFFNPIFFSDLVAINPFSDPDSILLTTPSILGADAILSYITFVLLPANSNTTFSASVTYSGPGAPDSQPYEILNGGSNLTTAGRTTPFGATPPPGTNIPEPGTLALLLGAGLLMALARSAAGRGTRIPRRLLAA